VIFIDFGANRGLWIAQISWKSVFFVKIDVY